MRRALFGFETTSFQSFAFRSFAELVIIVTGVLIALSADSWWTERDERNQELEILQAVDTELEVTLGMMERHMTRMGNSQNALRFLSEGSAGAAADLDDAGLADMLAVGLWDVSRLNVQMSTYDEIKSSGRLRLITDEEIRRLLARFDSRLNFERAREIELVEHKQRASDPYIIANVQLAQFSVPNSGREWFQPLVVGEAQNHRPLLDDTAFQNQVAAKYLVLSSLYTTSWELRDTTRELASVIDARLADVSK